MTIAPSKLGSLFVEICDGLGENRRGPYVAFVSQMDCVGVRCIDITLEVSTPNAVCFS